MFIKFTEEKKKTSQFSIHSSEIPAVVRTFITSSQLLYNDHGFNKLDLCDLCVPKILCFSQLCTLQEVEEA